MRMPSMNGAQIPRLLFNGVHTFTTEYPESTFTTMAALYIDVVGFSQFEQRYGTQVCNRVVDVISEALLQRTSQSTFPWPNVQAFHIWDDSFAVLLPQTDEHWAGPLLHDFVLQVEEAINQRLGAPGYPALRLRYGVSPAFTVDKDQPSESLYHMITMAGRIARRHASSIPLFVSEELEDILHHHRIRTVYQPILELSTRNMIGMESLARGPSGSRLERPLDLFDYAERLGRLLDLERICRNHAIRHAKLRPGAKLFINLSPKILSDPAFRQGETRKVIREEGLKPEQIVFEITEHHAIDDYQAFIRLVDHYREQGYGIAIDDVGAGYSGLVTLMQVKPDFVKIDMEIVRDIHEDSIRQDIVRAIQQISQGFSGTVIAEGIETNEELDCLKACGIVYGQGYLLGKPSPMEE